MPRRFRRFEKARAANCSCAGNSFWEGLCEWCRVNPPPPSKPIMWADYDRAGRIEATSIIDEIVAKCAVELGFAAGRDIAKRIEGL